MKAGDRDGGTRGRDAIEAIAILAAVLDQIAASARRAEAGVVEFDHPREFDEADTEVCVRVRAVHRDLRNQERAGRRDWLRERPIEAHNPGGREELIARRARRHIHGIGKRHRPDRRHRPRPFQRADGADHRPHVTQHSGSGDEAPAQRQRHLPAQACGRGGVGQRIRDRGGGTGRIAATDHRLSRRRSGATALHGEDSGETRRRAEGVRDEHRVTAALRRLHRRERERRGRRTIERNAIFAPLIGERSRTLREDAQGRRLADRDRCADRGGSDGRRKRNRPHGVQIV